MINAKKHVAKPGLDHVPSRKKEDKENTESEHLKTLNNVCGKAAGRRSISASIGDLVLKIHVLQKF